MKTTLQKTSYAALAAVLFTLVGTHQASAQTIVADWNAGPSKISPSTSYPIIDSVGGHNFQNSFGGGVPSTGTSSIGGPSSHPAFFSDGGYYGVEGGTTTLPTNNYTLSLYAQVATANLASNAILFSTNGGQPDDVQIGLYDGSFVAYYDTVGNNFVSSGGALNIGNSDSTRDSILIGSFVATNLGTHLSVTDINGVYTFTDNGVNDVSVDIKTLRPSDYLTSFNAPHIGVAPGGGGPNYTGYMSDITITAGVDSLPVPEPSTYVLMGLGLFGLVAFRRFRRSNA
jgi:hypothetical protein